MKVLEQEYTYFSEERKRLEKCLENISSEIGYLQDSIYTYDFFVGYGSVVRNGDGIKYPNHYEIK